MTLDQYIIYQKNRIGSFKKIYLEQARLNPESEYPLEMNEADWDEQFDILTGESL